MQGIKTGYRQSMFIISLMVLGAMLSAGKCSDTEVLDSVEDDSDKEDKTNDSNSENEQHLTEYDGVDLLVVVDNSGSMEEEQEILADSLFALMGNLAAALPRAAASNVRIGVVSSDLGLQFGPEHAIDDVSGAIDSCEKPYGDDGALFGASSFPTINVSSDLLACEDCPEGISTVGDTTTLDCSEIEMPETGYAETNADDPTVLFAGQIGCMAHLGTSGCGIEQQLSAAVRGLERNPSFLEDTHLLGVLIVSDEEDCSINERDLFLTPEWQSGPQEHLNVACNVGDNEDYLTDPFEYKDTIINLKGDENAVVFGAIVGVPVTDECQGSGSELDGCLELPEMKIETAQFQTSEGYLYTHFKPSCVREQNGVDVTSARPGRRYVKVAQEFGDDALVASICNDDFSPLMARLADRLAEKFN